MASAQWLEELREGDVKCMRNTVQRSDPRRDSASLDLNNRLAVHAGGLSEEVDRPSLRSALPRDCYPEGKDVRWRNGHTSTLPQ